MAMFVGQAIGVPIYMFIFRRFVAPRIITGELRPPEDLLKLELPPVIGLAPCLLTPIGLFIFGKFLLSGCLIFN